MTKKIFLAGHNGMVGSAIKKQIEKRKNIELITRSREVLDLTNQNDVNDFFTKEKPDIVILAAAKVGGILANDLYPADFIYSNIQIQNNVIHQAHLIGVQKLLFLGSSCIYPKFAEQPITEESLMQGKLESTNEPYAVAKIAGIKMCESYNRQYNRDYRSVMPTNLYGPGDNFHPDNSHVIPGLIRRMHEAKINKLPKVNIWGSGLPKREFLYVDDMADACLFILDMQKEKFEENLDPMLSHINIGTGVDMSIQQLALEIQKTVGFEGELSFDTSKPDGTPRKLLNVNKLDILGWKASINLTEGLHKTYDWALKNNFNYIKS
jgi:GDP-L-fucose synthase